MKMGGKSRAKRFVKPMTKENGHGLSEMKTIGHVGNFYQHGVEDKKDAWMFPRHSIWVIYVVTMVMRLYIVTDTNSWWILHPDEIYQSVEVAHSEVYGYGFRPYEYLPPPNLTVPDHSSKGSHDLPRPSAVQKQEAALGMYSLRSFLQPRLYVMVLWMKELLGIEVSPYLVCKIFHALVASHLPLAVYYFVYQACSLHTSDPLGRMTSSSHDLPALSAMFVATSLHLTVLGTHTLVNSLLAPFVFLALGMCLNHFKSHQSMASTNKVNCSNVGMKHTTCNGHCVLNHTSNDEQNVNNDKSSGLNGIEMTKKTDTPEFQKADDTSHLKRNGKLSISSLNGHSVGTKDFNSNDLQTTTAIDKENTLSQISQCVTTGIIIGLLIYIRLDLILFFFDTAALVILPSLHTWLKPSMILPSTSSLCRLSSTSVGLLLGLTIGGYDDYISYGQWFLSPIQWFRFNVQGDLSSTLFGSHPSLFYIKDVFLGDTVMTTCSVYQSVVFLMTCIMKILGNQKDNRHIHGLCNLYQRLTLALLILLVTYSSRGHKEVRFIHNLLVLYGITTSLSLVIILDMTRSIRTKWRRTFTWSMVVVLISHCVISFPSPKDSSNTMWAYLQAWDSHHTNQCLDFVGKQNDVSGVFLERSIHSAAAYSILHKDVPLFTKVHFEFHEFDQRARVRIPSIHIGGDHINVSVLNRVSNFIAVENSALVLKYLWSTPTYNYLVLRINTPWTDTGYKEVFRAGTMKVLKRDHSQQVDAYLKQQADRIPIGTNSTILEYEGSWLYTLGLYHKAIERIQGASQLERISIRAYQILGLAHGALGEVTTANKALQECAKQYGQHRCSEPQPKIVLHQDYNLNVRV